MTIKAGAALIFAAGLLMSVAGPLPATAASGDDTAAAAHDSATSKAVRHGSRHLTKIHADRNSTVTAAKPDDIKKAGDKQVAGAGGSAFAGAPSWIANANAQMTAADAPDSARGKSVAMFDKANAVVQAATDKPAEPETAAEPGTVNSDQPNAFERSLTPSDQPAAATTQPAAPASQGVVLASTSRPSSEQASNDSSTLDRTSMIGKIFIAVGALLTVASAARMFMA